MILTAQATILLQKAPVAQEWAMLQSVGGFLANGFLGEWNICPLAPGKPQQLQWVKVDLCQQYCVASTCWSLKADHTRKGIYILHVLLSPISPPPEPNPPTHYPCPYPVTHPYSILPSSHSPCAFNPLPPRAGLTSSSGPSNDGWCLWEGSGLPTAALGHVLLKSTYCAFVTMSIGRTCISP